MNIEIFLTFALAFGMVLQGLAFLYGNFHNSKKKVSIIFDLDDLFFRGKNTLIFESDKLAFWICMINGTLMFLHGLLQLLFENFPNIGMVFTISGFLGSWFSKYIFMFYFGKAPEETIPKFWVWKSFKR